MIRPVTELIQKRNLYEVVAERLVQDLVDQRLSPGDLVPTEKALTERYGVGRSSVREGLRMLESHGIIRMTPKGQYVVADHSSALAPSLQLLVSIGHASVEDITELRSFLEVRAAELAAERRSGEDLEAIGEAIDRMEASLEGSRQEMLAADLTFHVAVSAATGNPAIHAVSLGLRKVLEDALAESYWAADKAVAQHRLILAAISDRDVAEAGRQMREHLGWVQTILDEDSRSPLSGD
jgi:DNA-binding FadR family transcriptional regulator